MPRNKLTLLLAEYRSKAVDILDLTVSNPTQVGLEYPREVILESIASSRSLRYEPSPLGLESARSAVADYYQCRGERVHPKDIVLTASTSEAYGYLFKLLTDPDDHVLVPAPSYPLFEFLATSESLRCVKYPLVYEDEWRVDIARLERLLTRSTRALLIVHPNNPTGSLVKLWEWTRIRQTCKDLAIPVICDEVFLDYRQSMEEEADFLLETDVPVCVLNGLSKISGLPQLKLGWILLRGPAPFKEESRDRLETIADTYLSVGTPVQHALPQLLQIRGNVQPQIKRRLHENHKVLYDILASGAASPLKVEGGWYAVIRLPSILSEEDWCLNLLETHRTLVHPGYFYDFSDGTFAVVSLLTEPSVFSEGLARLRDLIRAICAV